MAAPELSSAEALLIKLFNGAPLIKTMGLQLNYNESDQAVIRLPYNPGLDHGFHQIHGGVIATLLDTAGWFTVAPHFQFWIATVEFSTRLLEPVEKQDLVAVGKLLRKGKRLAFCDMEVRAAEDKLIATGSGTFAVTSVPATW